MHPQPSMPAKPPSRRPASAGTGPLAGEPLAGQTASTTAADTEATQAARSTAAESQTEAATSETGRVVQAGQTASTTAGISAGSAGHAFVPPLAPSPPPSNPPTVQHRRLSATHDTRRAGTGLPDAGGPNTAGRVAGLPDVPRPAARRAATGLPDTGFPDIGLPATGSPDPGLPDTAKRAAEGPGSDARPGTAPSDGAVRNPSRTLRTDLEVWLQRSNGATSSSSLALVRRVAATVVIPGSAASAYFLIRDPNGYPALPAGPGFLDQSSSFLAAVPAVWAAWLPVFAGALAYTVYQWLPAQRLNPRHEWAGWAAITAVVLGTLWLWAATEGHPAAATWIAVILVLAGLAVVHRINGWPPSTRAEHLITDVPAGAFLGVSVLALLASLGSWLVQSGADVGGWGGEAWTLVALVSVVVGVTTICMTDRGHLSVALTVVWGLGWIGVARLLEDPAAVWPAVGAFVAAFLIIVSASSRRQQVDHARRLADRQQLKAESSGPAAGEAPEAART